MGSCGHYVMGEDSSLAQPLLSASQEDHASKRGTEFHPVFLSPEPKEKGALLNMMMFRCSLISSALELECLLEKKCRDASSSSLTTGI